MSGHEHHLRNLELLPLVPAPTVWVGGTPSVWIGCLSHFNAGALVGDWFDAIDDLEVTVADVHRGSGRDGSHCEGLWVFDHEGIPVSGR